MGALVRSHDWSRTELGPIETWPRSLLTAVDVCLNSRFPMVVFWGPSLITLYNDAYRPSFGSKHPRVLGAPAATLWPEAWHLLGPMMRQVVESGVPTWSEDQMLLMDRHGFSEETHWTFSYSPIRGESGRVEGVFTAVSETTTRVLGERRLRTLRELGSEVSRARGVLDTARVTADVLSGNPRDLPFALIYLGDRKRLLLGGTSGETLEHLAAPQEVTAGSGAWDFEGVLFRVLERGEAARVEVPRGPLPSMRALVLPIASQGQEDAAGVLVVGISPHLEFDENYRGFLGLVAGQLATAISTARTYEEEKKRAEALAEIDRAKTAFFSNVSHEFRTPLTLMLGPVEDGLADPEHPLPPVQRERQELVHRNCLRLLKLVNTLLDFSRIEAGRVQASYVPTDLARLTADLASTFRSAIEKAGVRLRVECAPLPEAVWVDREMWEKVVLNLLSNAFKFTFEGEISVALRARGERVELAVRDTGTGIAQEELPRIFERFHRVKGAQGRSYEGSGIGLALVQELVRLHGGEVRVQSALGDGTTFTVSLPFGNAHLPRERLEAAASLASTSTGAAAYVQEASGWLGHVPEPESLPAAPHPQPVMSRGSSMAPRGHILVADDNADMREYVRRLLEGPYTVEAVENGTRALEAARARPPDLVLSDVMMPGLDGFGLLRALKGEERTAAVPVILLSARAGEEAKVEGFEAGADDYLVKPFGARELVARVEGAVKAGRAKAERERLLREVDAARKRLLGLFEHAPAFVCSLGGPQHVFEMVNPRYRQLVGAERELVGLPLREALPELVAQGLIELLDGIYRTGEPVIGQETLLRLDRGGEGRLEDAFVTVVRQPRRNARGELEGIDIVGFEVTEQVLARRKAEALAEELRHRAEFEEQLIGIVSHDLRTPVSAILLGVTALRRGEALSERQMKSVARIQSSAERAHRMIRDLLDFTQARLTGSLLIERRATDLHELIQGVLEEVQATHGGRELRVSRGGDGRGEWDPDRLSQVVQNLVTNALKYSPADTPVHIETHAEDRGVTLSVHNEGAPIPPERLASIFQPLERASGEVDTAGRGIGLGLYIVKQVVDAHGGRVWVKSKAEAGTTFTVWIPRTGR
jgi:signal transduction histidine kinase